MSQLRPFVAPSTSELKDLEIGLLLEIPNTQEYSGLARVGHAYGVSPSDACLDPVLSNLGKLRILVNW
jgi:hypothetical protein